MLQEMAGIVHRGWRQHDVSFDVRAALTNQPDEQWTDEDRRRRPEFVGVALSTLDTSEYGTWKRAQSRARFGDDVPSEVLTQYVPSRAAAARPEVWVADDPRDSVPTAAEVCDALYGGFHTSTESRRLAGELEAAWPPLRHHTYAGRTLLRRMVQHLIAAGVDQFLDIGGGIAQHGATHKLPQNRQTPQIRHGLSVTCRRIRDCLGSPAPAYFPALPAAPPWLTKAEIRLRVSSL
ncbi:SAM-dependent methyltransferase [Dactylosporangium sp. CA-233914]|uniref:SAM-dependent methyltransferase n=1 Tax=Dactylosporangium sp. CA-233914 TaxID=3239934 RepID=UPI003D8A69B1